MMNYQQLVKCLLIMAILLCTQIHARAQHNGIANTLVPQEDAILQWNRVLMETIRTPGQQPSTIMPVRSNAMMHAAMFDAVNSIDRTYTPDPTCAGNNAAIGTSQATMLALFFGRDDIRFQHTWEGAGGATRSYAGFVAMADEEARSRVYAGIHFTFDNVAGQSIGQNVANYVFLNFMRPGQCVR